MDKSFNCLVFSCGRGFIRVRFEMSLFASPCKGGSICENFRGSFCVTVCFWGKADSTDRLYVWSLGFSSGVIEKWVNPSMLIGVGNYLMKIAFWCVGVQVGADYYAH